MDEKDLQQYAVWSKDMYRFVMNIMDYMKKPHDYGTGTILNMVEMHTLAMVSENPGITVGEVAKRWNRTMSAASRNIERLCTKKYVEKRKENGNEKTIHLYVTSTGQQLCDLHSELDEREIRNFTDYIRQKCSKEDLAKFHEIMKLIEAFYCDDQQNQRKREEADSAQHPCGT